ncbi:MAG: tetratricopeptide repeat protein [Tepidisphaeraceae bacterium]
MSNPKACRFQQMGLGLLLLCATALAYWPALRGGMIMDDAEHVTAPALQSVAGLWRIWSVVGATHQYFPILHSAFWLEHRLWGDSVLGYHLTNVILHAGSACLLVAIMRRLALPGAWLAGFIFALHPVCVESVAWISEQKNTLSTFLGLVSVQIYLRFDETRRPSSYAIALAAFLLSVLSKNVTVTLPAVLLVIFWWKRGRLEWKRDVLPLLPWFVLGILAVQPAAGLERKMCAASPELFSLSLVQRGLVAGRVFWFYLAKLAWPADLVYMYPRWTVNAGVGWQYAFPLGALVLLAGLCLLARRNRGPLAAFLIFAGTLFPVLGFLNVYWFALSYVGDHLQYLSCLAIIALFASAAAFLAGKLPRGIRSAAIVPAVGLLVTLGALTWRQSGIYRDPETLYRATLAQNPASWAAHYNLGDVLNQQPGRQAEVIAQWEATLRYRPDFPEAQNNLACLLASDPNRTQEAIEHFQAALREKPDFADAHANLAALLSNFPDQTQEATEQFEAALRYDPDSAQTHNNFGNMLMDIPGRLDDAIAQLQEALRLNPDYAEAHWNLSIALSRIPARLPEAISHVQAALRLEPDIQGGPQLLAHLRELQREQAAGNSAPPS